MRIPWYVTALGAAIVWGIHYPLLDQALRRVSLYAALLLTALPMALLAPFFYRELAADYATWRALDARAQLAIAALMLTSLAGSVLLFVSIAGKNATLASLIEISYPFFVALFAFLLFREVQVNNGVLVGGGLVFIGVAMIILSSR